MATLKTRIEGTVTAVRVELTDWQAYLHARRSELGRELAGLATPAAVKLAVLEAADGVLTRAQAEVHARAEAASLELKRARRRPAAVARKGAKPPRVVGKAVRFPSAVAA